MHFQGRVTQRRMPVSDGPRDLQVIRYGHFGRPLLMFPSEAGQAWQPADFGLIDAIGPLIDAGRVTVFTVDTLDDWTWSAYDVPTEERARRHAVYQRWIAEAVVPWIFDELGGPAEIMTTGVSMGAYHAVQMALTRADLFPLAIAMSGNYDPASFRGFGEPGEATYFANPMSFVPHLHGDHLEWLRSRLSLLLVVGQGPFEWDPTRALPGTLAFARVLADRGIRHELDVWGHDSAHDWPWWHRQLAHHLPRFV